MTLRAFAEVHASAVRRIGLKPSKGLGTTPHGHRHAFGRWLSRANASEKLIQVVLHQRSIVSQKVYTASDEAEAHEILGSLQERHANATLFRGMADPS